MTLNEIRKSVLGAEWVRFEVITKGRMPFVIESLGALSSYYDARIERQEALAINTTRAGKVLVVSGRFLYVHSSALSSALEYIPFSILETAAPVYTGARIGEERKEVPPVFVPTEDLFGSPIENYDASLTWSHL